MFRMHCTGFKLRPTVALLLGSVAVSIVAWPAQAAQVPWSEEPLTYTVVDQDLRDLLTEIGTRVGIRVRVSDAVKGRVRGRLPPAPPREFLAQLATMYGFEWFYDGGTIWVSAPSESLTRMMQLGAVPLDQVVTAMDELGLSDTRWPLRGSGEAGIVVVNGPPRFVVMAEQALAALQQRARPPVANDIRVFRGQSSGTP